ncbi:MAG: hypothetical protein IKR83_06040 [Bacteroidales bacterium]|nr:hypothetical protein [Bacteroidales bacterium]
MDKFELQRLRDHPIEGVAERLGLEVSRHKALCPFHNDHHASLSFNVRKNTYRCFVCDAHGDTIDLVRHLLNKDFHEACTWLAGSEVSSFRFQDSGGCRNNLEHESRNLKPRTFDASRYTRFFQHPYLSPAAKAFLFDQRRLDPRVVRWCRLTSWRDRQGIHWLQIPYFDPDGRLVGIQNRNLTPGAEPRFRFPKGAHCGIYNLPVLRRLGEGDELWITEGASDCWAMLSAGHKAIAVPSATLLNPKDKEILQTTNSQLSTEFHIYPDNDLPGERLYLQLRELLPGLVRHQLPQGCKDYSEYYMKLKIKGS